MSSSNSSSFKRRVRARMTATGENYTTAMRALQADITAAAVRAQLPEPAASYRRPPAGSTWSYRAPANDDEVRRLRDAERGWEPFVGALEELGLHPYFELSERDGAGAAPTLFAESGGDRCVEISSHHDETPLTPRAAVALAGRTGATTFLVYVHARGGMVADAIEMDYRPDLDDTPETFAERIWLLVEETRGRSRCMSSESR